MPRSCARVLTHESCSIACTTLLTQELAYGDHIQVVSQQIGLEQQLERPIRRHVGIVSREAVVSGEEWSVGERGRGPRKDHDARNVIEWQGGAQHERALRRRVRDGNHLPGQEHSGIEPVQELLRPEDEHESVGAWPFTGRAGEAGGEDRGAAGERRRPARRRDRA